MLEEAYDQEKISNSAPSFDKLAQEYDAWFENDGKFVFLTELAVFKSLSSSLQRPWFKVGVGSGRFAQHLKVDVGIDPSIWLLTLAKNRGIKVVLGYGEKLPFEDVSLLRRFFQPCFRNQRRFVI